jgi:hypothetical protein
MKKSYLATITALTLILAAGNMQAQAEEVSISGDIGVGGKPVCMARFCAKRAAGCAG